MGAPVEQVINKCGLSSQWIGFTDQIAFTVIAAADHDIAASEDMRGAGDRVVVGVIGKAGFPGEAIGSCNRL